jgi:ABC-type nitrate/sulfonate/bicarbonate transport system substrate-binding protein
MVSRSVKRLLALMSAAAVTLTVFAARPARADTTTTIAVVGSGVTAAVLIIALVGTSLTEDEELDTLLQPRDVPLRRPGDDERVKFGTRCPRVPGGALALCW